MGKANDVGKALKFTCDHRGCEISITVPYVHGQSCTPSGWGTVDVSYEPSATPRKFDHAPPGVGPGGVFLWLCPEHLKKLLCDVVPNQGTPKTR